MTATLTTTEDDLYGRLKDVWDAPGPSAGVALVYQNVGVADGVAPPNEGTVSWARASVQTSLSRQTAFGHSTRRYENTGVLSVQIFTPVGVGLKQAKTLAEIVLAGFRGHRTTNGVIFRDMDLVDVGSDGKWYQLNVLVNFEVDEIA